jgi:hypothetical protein
LFWKLRPRVYFVGGLFLGLVLVQDLVVRHYLPEFRVVDHAVFVSVDRFEELDHLGVCETQTKQVDSAFELDEGNFIVLFLRGKLLRGLSRKNGRPFLCLEISPEFCRLECSCAN